MLRRNPLWWSPVFTSACGVDRDSRMLYKILHVVDKSDYYSLFFLIALLTNKFRDGLLTVLRKFLLILNKINKLRIAERIVLPPALVDSAGIWSVPGNLCLFSFSLAISSSKVLGLDPNDSAVCISVCLTSLLTYLLTHSLHGAESFLSS